MLQRGKSLGTRLVRLESQARGLPRPAEEPRDEDEWLAVFEQLGRDCVFKPEPDFPVALAFFSDALKRAHASTNPPFDPPAEFRPGDPPHLRRECWRARDRFPDVDEGFMWLAEILERINDGIPPVTEAEFRELTEWFNVHEAQLRQISLPSYLLDLGGGRQTSCSNLCYLLARGSRAVGAGQLAADVRLLRQRYGF
ncbi:MAG: hypothetical protein K8U57_04350 [Planctomycetes bacterium]|nr:hypothetical protein [Planctomycetota bacterium]